MTQKNITTISIQHYGERFTAEISSDSTTDQMADVMRGLMICIGFSDEQVDRAMGGE